MDERVEQIISVLAAEKEILDNVIKNLENNYNESNVRKSLETYNKGMTIIRNNINTVLGSIFKDKRIQINKELVLPLNNVIVDLSSKKLIDDLEVKSKILELIILIIREKYSFSNQKIA